MTIEGSEPSVPPTAPYEAPLKKMNVFERAAGVLFSPGETFENIARKPDILAPMLLLLVVSYIGTILLVPRIDFGEAVRQQIQRQGRQMSDSDMDTAVRIGSAFGKVIAYTSPFLAFALIAIIAGVLLLAFRLFGGEGTYAQAYSASLYAWIPQVINGLILGIVGLTRDGIDPTLMPTLVKSNPAFLVDMKAQPMLFAFLASIDVFTIWSVILFIIGFSILARVSKAKAASIVLSLWAALIVVKLGFAALGAAAASKKPS
jgi:hypothetical protein